MKKTIFALALLLIPSFLQAEVVTFDLSQSQKPDAVKIEIPAKLETTRAKLSKTRGSLNVDLADPSKTTGTIEVDLESIQGHSFDSEGKNKTQTEHMHNWFEISNDFPADVRAKNRWAKFEIKKVVSVAPAQGSPGRKLQITAEGDFTVHGITKPKTVQLNTSLDGKTLQITTQKPFIVSLKEHEVRPRDNTGKFLAKSLEVIGLKISDNAEVSLDLKAVSK